MLVLLLLQIILGVLFGMNKNQRKGKKEHQELGLKHQHAQMSAF